MSKKTIPNIKNIILDIIKINTPMPSQEIIFEVKKQCNNYKNKIDLMDKITDTLNDLIREKEIWVTVYDDCVGFEYIID